VERYPATLSVFGAGTLGHAVHRYRSAGGTDQGFLVSVCRDQNQRFRRPVLLHAPTSHKSALPAGYGGTDLATPPTQFTGTRGVAQRLYALNQPGAQMGNLKVLVSSLVVLVSSAAAAEAQKVHEIRLDANPSKEVYRFTPPLVTARPGDVLLFRATSGTPHSIVFEGAGLSEQAHEALNGAMSRRAGDLSSPLLTLDGSEYRIVIPQIPPGIYHFYCLPHRAYDMRGQLRVTK
jgi:plastocyanin